MAPPGISSSITSTLPPKIPDFHVTSIPSLLSATKSYLISTPVLRNQLFLHLILTVLSKVLPRLIPLRHVPIPHPPSPSHIHDYLPNNAVTITDIRLGILAIIIPIFLPILFSSSSFLTIDVAASHKHLVTYLFSCTLNELATDTLKYTVRRLRPNFYAMCAFDEATHSCTASHYRMEQAFKSFPSGHSSLSFVAATVLSLFFHRRLQNLAVSLPATLLFFATATFVAVTRVLDRWHHVEDVTAGAIIGIASALLADRYMNKRPDSDGSNPNNLNRKRK